jgi:hypothetical protein
VNEVGTEGSATGKSVGSFQQDEFKSHNHSYSQFPGERGNIADGRHWESKQGETGYKGGKETRPKNVYVNYLIRFRA